jgi:deferrochelatase/peroxidase EfeB
MPDFDPAKSLGDVQGFILRGYGMPRVRYLVLRIADPPAARAFLAGLVSGDAAASPQLTTATPWTEKPEATVNVALTHAGLRALGVPQTSLASFPTEFVEGAAARAARLDDTGESAPDHWVEGLRPEDDPHLLLIIFAQDEGACAKMTGGLRTRFAAQGACTELTCRDGGALPNGRVHFGYRDGISQPVIEGAPERQLADRQPPAPTGEFLLGYPSQFVDFSYRVPQPDELGQNGSFGVFRIGKQEVQLFEAFLEKEAAKHQVSKEWVAAKLCGRWRNGLPLSLSPEADHPALADEALNDFDYVKSNTFPADPRGLRCPVGAHIRRCNPRGSFIAGGDDSHKHRIVRRGLPYGPPYDPNQPDDGVERGLLGMFICVSIRDQFEFLISQWIKEGTFAPGISGTLAIGRRRAAS